MGIYKTPLELANQMSNPTRDELLAARQDIIDSKDMGEVPQNISFGEIVKRHNEKYPFLKPEQIKKYLIENAKIDYTDDEPYENVMNKYRQWYENN